MEIGTFEWDWRPSATLACSAVAVGAGDYARWLAGPGVSYWHWVGMCALFYVVVRCLIAGLCLTYSRAALVDVRAEILLATIWGAVALTTAGFSPARTFGQEDALAIVGMLLVALLSGIKSEPRGKARSSTPGAAPTTGEGTDGR